MAALLNEEQTINASISAEETINASLPESQTINAQLTPINYIPGYKQAEEERRANEEIRISNENIRKDNENNRIDYYNNLKSRVDSGEFDGATFLPNVNTDGDISWTNNRGLDNPTTRNIRGPKGDAGPQGIQGIQGPTGPQGETGPQGIQGPTGKDFTISKTYSSIIAMYADKDNVEIGDFVIISTNVEDPDNAKLYIRNNTQEGFGFITDMSGATGVKGDKGDQGIQGPQGEQGPQGPQGVPGPTYTAGTNINISANNEISAPLTDYVKKTNYAGSSTAGVIKTDNSFKINGQGKVYAEILTYNNYQSAGDGRFISKGTLENVFTGKEFVDANDLATKQDILTPGDNITIQNNVISASGGADIPQQDTAPSNPSEDDLWIDTSEDTIIPVDSEISVISNNPIQNQAITNYVNNAVLEKYSTTETMIGYWNNNKPLYRRVLVFNLPQQENTWITLTTINNIDQLVDVRGSISGYLTVPHYLSPNYNCNFQKNGSDIQVYTKGYPNAYTRIIIEYTKTTD